MLRILIAYLVGFVSLMAKYKHQHANLLMIIIDIAKCKHQHANMLIIIAGTYL